VTTQNLPSAMARCLPLRATTTCPLTPGLGVKYDNRPVNWGYRHKRGGLSRMLWIYHRSVWEAASTGISRVSEDTRRRVAKCTHPHLFLYVICFLSVVVAIPIMRMLYAGRGQVGIVSMAADEAHQMTWFGIRKLCINSGEE
jgi:cytochrome b561